MTDSELLLARMRRAVAQLRLEELAVEEVGVALRSGRISASGAVAWLRANGVADLVLTDLPEDKAA